MAFYFEHGYLVSDYEPKAWRAWSCHVSCITLTTSTLTLHCLKALKTEFAQLRVMSRVNWSAQTNKNLYNKLKLQTTAGQLVIARQIGHFTQNPWNTEDAMNYDKQRTMSNWTLIATRFHSSPISLSHGARCANCSWRLSTTIKQNRKNVLDKLCFVIDWLDVAPSMCDTFVSGFTFIVFNSAGNIT